MYMSSPNAMRISWIGSIGARGRKGVLTPITPATREG